jgi:hypothetical protein
VTHGSSCAAWMFALSQTPAVDGHAFMTNIPDSPDLAAVAYEAQVEILTAETIQAAEATPDDAARAFDAAELGYYEAELRSLRDAATTLNEAEQKPE